MVGTRTRKVVRDIVARKGRSLLVILSIVIGVFGVTVMVSVSDLLSSQLEQDLRSEAISHLHIYVRSTGEHITLAQNQRMLDRLAAMEGVVDVEGQGVYPVTWRAAGSDQGEFEDGYVVTFTEPFAEADLEPIARVTAGRYPEVGAREIAIEQRFADAHAIAIEDELVFGGTGATQASGQPWTVVGFVLHPYFTIDPALQDQIQASDAVYANYADAQQITAATGLTAFHVRATDNDTAARILEPLRQTIATETPYTTIFNFIDDPQNNFVLNIVAQVALTLSMLGVLAMVVSGFLVTNVMNAMVVEQRRQIGAMKSLGATTWDAFVVYAGIALCFGAVGTAIGMGLAIPIASLMARAIATQALTYISGWQFSAQGIAVGVAMGLLVPVVAALLPVLNGMRISILEAITDRGLGSNWGRSWMSRAIGSLPLPGAVIQGLSHIYQQRGRLALTGLALTFAAAAFMGVTAVDRSLSGYVAGLNDRYAYEIEISPQDAHEFEAIQHILERNIDNIDAVYPGYSATVGIEGFESSNPLAEGSNQVTAIGVDPARPAVVFELRSGSGWSGDSRRGGVVISRTVADNLGRGVGDTLQLTIGGQHYDEPVIGVDDYGFDALYIDWRVLARRAGYVDQQGDPVAGVYYVDLQGQPGIQRVDDRIDAITAALVAEGVHATYVNRPQQSDAQAQQVAVFGVVFNATSLLMAVVGAIGLMAALSMAVYERQKEIGVRRSIGATSLIIMGQFMLEGLMVGVLAWLLAAPLSVGLGVGLMDLLPFDYLSFSYPPYVLAWGLVGILITAALASLGPSIAASRKTVADILRYQ